MCLKVGRVASRSANLMDHKPYIFWQDNLCDTQPLLAAFVPQGCRLPELFQQQPSWLPSFTGAIKILS